MVKKEESWFERHLILTIFLSIIILFLALFAFVIIAEVFSSSDSSSNNLPDNISNDIQIDNTIPTTDDNISNDTQIGKTDLTWQEEISEIENKYNIKIEYNTISDIDYSYYSAKVTALSEEDTDALTKYVEIFYTEFNRYPPDFIKNVGLKKVAFVKNLSVIGQNRAAMPRPEIETVFYDIYLGNYDKLYQQKVVHHEFYHLIEWNINGDMFYKDPAWAALNDPAFTYGSGGASAYENINQYRSKVLESGFISVYSTYGLEEDKAEIFADLMVPELYRNMTLKTADDEILNKKVDYMKNFLSKYSTHMNEDFWNNMLISINVILLVCNY